MSHTITIAAALAFVAVLPAVSAQAQAPRTFVSAAGNDSNPCSFAAPCRHFQAAVNATSAGGEVDALDPAGYGPIIIHQAITIEGQGWSYIAPPANGDGISISAVSGKVTIRGVSLNGVGISDVAGIVFNSGTVLNVENCVIENFSGTGILFQPNSSTLSTISVSNTKVSDNSFGIAIQPTGTGTTTGFLNHVDSENNNADGINLSTSSQTLNVTVTESVSANNGGAGVKTTANNGASSVYVRNSTISNNLGFGLSSTGLTSLIVVTRSMVAANATASIGLVDTYSDNNFVGNGDNDRGLGPLTYQ